MKDVFILETVYCPCPLALLTTVLRAETRKHNSIVQDLSFTIHLNDQIRYAFLCVKLEGKDGQQLCIAVDTFRVALCFHGELNLKYSSKN